MAGWQGRCFEGYVQNCVVVRKIVSELSSGPQKKFTTLYLDAAFLRCVGIL
jgi:hypothetical protein